MTFKFYHYASNKRNFNKGPLLGTALTITDTHLPGMQDIENPSIIIDSSGANAAAGYNYLYIQDWARYYFIVKRTWLADGALLINCQEDYIYTAKSLIEAQTGYCRYSGLGDGNLNDPRVGYKPQLLLEKFPTAPVKLSDGTADTTSYLYFVKFISENPFVATNTVGNCGMNVAVLNSEGWRAFRNTYYNLTEKERVAAANCIQSVNRTMYSKLTSSGLINSTFGVRFQNPYADTGFDDVKIQWSMADYPDAICVIITGEDSERLFLAPVGIEVEKTDLSGAQIFNTNGRFYKLNAQYFLKLVDLQPIPFSPKTYGFKESFRICAAISYECFSENIVITFRQYNSTYHDYNSYAGAHAPLTQRCQTSVAFLVDKALDLSLLRNLNNEMQLIGGCFGSAISAMTSAWSYNAGGVVSGMVGIPISANNYEMTSERIKLSEFMNMGLSGNVDGSLSWDKNYFNTDGYCYVITEEPIMLPWGYLGIPDYNWRTVLSLAGTGYAEIDLVDISGNGSTYNYTDNELTQIKILLSQGVIFNATP